MNQFRHSVMGMLNRRSTVNIATCKMPRGSASKPYKHGEAIVTYIYPLSAAQASQHVEDKEQRQRKQTSQYGHLKVRELDDLEQLQDGKQSDGCDALDEPKRRE